MKYLVVYGQPTRQFFPNAAEAAAGGVANQSKHALLLGISPLTSQVAGDARGGDAENPNMSFTLDNRFGQVRDLYGIPPAGARAALFDDDDVEFEGVVKGLSLGPQAVLQVKA